MERTLLRRLYGAPELLQLIATFGVVLLVKDAALAVWGAEDLLGPRAPGLAGAIVDFRPGGPAIRSFADRARAGRAGRLVARARAHPLGPARARGDRGSRHDRGARRQSIVAFFWRVLRRRPARRPRGRAAAAARAGQSEHGPDDHRRRLRRDCRRRARQHRRSVRGGADHWRGQGAVHRHRRRRTVRLGRLVCETDPRRGICRHGSGAGRPAVGTVRKSRRPADGRRTA